MRQLKKITKGTVLGEEFDPKNWIGKRVLRIVGLATGMRTGPSKYEGRQPWVAFTGSFGCQRYDGETFKAPTLILPDNGAAESIAERLKAAINSGDLEAICQIEGDVMVCESRKSPTGYSWLFLPVEREDDPVEALMSGLPTLLLPPSEDDENENLEEAKPKKKGKR